MKRGFAVVLAVFVALLVGLGVGMLISSEESDDSGTAGSGASTTDEAPSTTEAPSASAEGPAAEAPRPVPFADLYEERVISETVEFGEAQARLGGRAISNAVIAELSDFDAETGWQAEIPVDSGLDAFQGQIGVSSDEPDGTQLRLAVKKDTGQGTVLYKGTFTPTRDAQDVNFDVQGAKKLILLWTATGGALPDDSADFVFADARLTGTE